MAATTRETLLAVCTKSFMHIIGTIPCKKCLHVIIRTYNWEWISWLYSIDLHALYRLNTLLNTSYSIGVHIGTILTIQLNIQLNNNWVILVHMLYSWAELLCIIIELCIIGLYILNSHDIYATTTWHPHFVHFILFTSSWWELLISKSPALQFCSFSYGNIILATK